MGYEGNSMGSMFTTFLLIILGLALTPQVASSVTTALVNLTGISASILPLVTVMWVFIILGIGAAAVYSQFKKLR